MLCNEERILAILNWYLKDTETMEQCKNIRFYMLREFNINIKHFPIRKKRGQNRSILKTNHHKMSGRDLQKGLQLANSNNWQKWIIMQNSINYTNTHVFFQFG